MESAIIIGLTAIGGLTAGLTSYYSPILGQISTSATIKPEVREAINQAVSIMDGGRTTGFCIAGAAAGALVSLCFMESPNYKVMARKMMACTMSSILFSPKLMEWAGWPTTTTNILFVSGLFALVAWTIIQIVLAKAGPWFTAWLGAKLPEPPQPTKPQ